MINNPFDAGTTSRPLHSAEMLRKFFGPWIAKKRWRVQNISLGVHIQRVNDSSHGRAALENMGDLSQQEASRSVPPEEDRCQAETSSPRLTSSLPPSGLSLPGENCAQGSAEVMLADKRRRFAVLVAAGVLVLGGAAGVGGLGYGIYRLDPLQPDQLRQKVAHLKQATAGIACLGAVSFLGAAGWLFRLGWKINRTGQYPPPGMPVLWTTQIRRGSPALLRANCALVGAVLLAAAGTIGMVWLYQWASQTLQALIPRL